MTALAATDPHNPHTGPESHTGSSVPTTTATPPPRVTPSGRLGQGELRRQVAAHLAAHPTEVFTPTAIATALAGRSSGAVLNALQSLTQAGHARHVGTQPHRFTATPTTPTAAQPGPTPAHTATHTPPRTAPPRPATPRPTAPAENPTSASAPSTGVPSAPTSLGPPAPTKGPVRRPNGQMYHPRLLADQPDVDVLRKLRDASIPALLYGPPGTGKTSVIEAAFGEDLITVAGDGDTTVADLVGEYTQNDDGTYTFVYGPLVEAMRYGRVLFVDDATLVSPKVLATLYPAMDGRRQITIKAYKGEVVTAAPGFYVIAGHNPGVHGAILTEALASRFSAQIKVTTDYDLARALKVDRRAVAVARHLATRAESGDIGWAPQLRELLGFARLQDVLGLDAAVANLLGIAPEEDRHVVADAITKHFRQPANPLGLGRQI